MFVIKFNKMIRNKWIWGAFAVVVCVAFAGTDLLMGSNRRELSRNAVGTIKGKEVTGEQLRLVRRSLELGSRGQYNESLAPEAWKILAELRYAEELGLSVSDKELQAAIRGDRTFAGEDGVFSADRYRRTLDALQLHESEFLGIMRNRILASKVEAAAAAGAWSSPSLAADQARNMTDLFTVRATTISNKFASADLEVSDDDLQNAYKTNIARFTDPETVKVAYVTFLTSDYGPKAREAITEEEIEDYYDSHTGEFEVKDEENPTNGVKRISLEDAKDTILGKLAVPRSRELAGDAADSFADKFYYGDAKSAEFEAIAAAQGLNVKTSSYFAVTSRPQGIDAKADFANAAFNLNPEGEDRDRVSDAVRGNDATYVLLYVDRKPSKVYPFEEVQKSVKSLAVAIARERAYDDYLSKTHADILAALTKPEPATFEEACAAAGDLPIGTNMVVTAPTAGRILPGGNETAAKILRLNKNEITPVIKNGPLSAVIVQVVERQPGDPEQLKLFTPNLERSLQWDLHNDALNHWRDSLLAAMEVKPTNGDLRAVSEDEDSLDDEKEEEE